MTTLAKFGNSLKFEPRGSGIGVTYAPVYGNGLWLAVRQDAEVVTSTDGVNWNVATSNLASMLPGVGLNESIISKIRYLNNQFIIIYRTSGSSPISTGILTSTDGLTWTSITGLTVDGVSLEGNNDSLDTLFYDITYVNSAYYVAASRGASAAREAIVYRSTNLSAWTARYTHERPQSFSEYYFTSIITKGTKVVATGYYKIVGSSGNYPIVAVSSNSGTSFAKPSVRALSTTTDYSLLDLASDSTGTTFMAVGLNGVIYANYNALLDYPFGASSWGKITSPTTSNINSVSFANGLWTIYTYDGKIYTRPLNGDAWTQKTLVTSGLAGVYGYSNRSYPSATDGTKTITFQYISTDSSTYTQIDFKVPNQQPYLDYTADPKWTTWKTMDFWVYVEGISYEYKQYGIASQWNGNSTYWAVYLVTQQGGHTPYVQVDVSGANGGYSTIIPTLEGTVTTGQWNHIRLSKNGTTGAIYINGSKAGTFAAPTVWPNGGSLNIGRVGDGYESNFPRDTAYWLDEFMMSSELFTDTSVNSFTVPTNPYVSNSNTLLLLHFDTDYLDDTRKAIEGTALITSSATVDAVSTKTTRAVSNLSTSSQITAVPTRIKQGTTLEASNATLTADAAVINTSQAYLVAFASELSVGVKLYGLQATLTSSSQVTATASKIFGSVTNISSNSSINAAASKIYGAQARLEALDTILSTGSAIQHSSARLESTSTLTVEGYVNQDVYARFEALASTLTVGERVKHPSAVLTSTTTLQANLTSTGVTKQGIANFTVQSSVVASGQIFAMDPNLTWVIQAEDRYYKIAKDYNDWIIEKENRNYTL